MFFAVAIIVFCVLAMVGIALTNVLHEKEEAQQNLIQRLDTQTGVAPKTEKSRAKTSLVKDFRLSSIEVLNSWLSRISFISKLAQKMRQAGMNRRVGEVVLYIPLLASLGFLGGLTLGGSVGPAVILALVGASIPNLVIGRMRAKRIQKFGEQLPDALDLVRAALQAGHSLISALKVVAEEFPDPVATEFDTVAEEIKLGLPMREALLGLQDRVDDPNVPVLVVGVLVVQESGGNLAEVLGNVSHTVRERFKLLRDVEVMTAQGKLSGGMLTCLPVLVAVALYFMTPGYFDAMFEAPTGMYMVAYAVCSILFGHLMISRIVRIKV